MKIGTRKLTLQRETLAPLQREDLGDIHGGTTPATPGLFSLSVRFCEQASAISLRACAAASASLVASVKKTWEVSKQTVRPTKDIIRDAVAKASTHRK